MDSDVGIRSSTVSLWLSCLLVAVALTLATGLAAEDRNVVDLDDYVERQRPPTEGGRMIFKPRPVAFTARVKSHPERIRVEYLYQALAIGRVSPLPKVSHQMFVESDGGQIIAVYVEDQAVDGIVADFALETQADFEAYHVYNYSRGPAMVVEAVR